MITFTKLKKYLFMCISIGIISFSSGCDSIIPPYRTIPTYACDWQDSVLGYFNNVALGICSNCNYSFTFLDTYMPKYSLYDAMDYLSTFYVGQYESLSFKWTGTIVDKQCTDNTKTSYSFTLDQDNFRSRLFPLDILEGIPLVRDSNIFPIPDIKYALDFQIKGVYDDNGNRGTLTWTKTWMPGDINHSFTSNSFFFTFSPDNSLINASFTSTQGVRYIYVHDHFEEY